MGVYFKYPVDTLIHTSPRWRIKEGYLNQDTGEVYLYAEATSTAGSFSYSYIYVQLVCVYPSGEYTMNRICGKDNPGFGDMYGDFSGSITVDLNDGAEYCYLAMRCSQYEDTDYGSGGSHCTISSDADHDPGYEIPGTRVTLDTTKAPVISNLRNTNPYNGHTSVSASMDSISFAFDSTGEDAPTKTYYSFGDYWREIPNAGTSHSISGYQPGTTVKFNVMGSNEAGNSNILDGVIRTRYENPVVSATVVGSGLESLTVNWSSTRPLKQLDYSIAGGYEIIQLNGDKSGTITLTGLSPNTRYPIYINGTSTDEYDTLGSETITIYGTTASIPTITNISAITHGQSFTITVNNPSKLSTTIKIWVSGNSVRLDKSIDTTTNGSVTVTLSESEWDKVYRSFPKQNTHTLYAQLVTHASKDYSDSQKSKTITLTGIQKTAHIGVSNKPRRCQVYIGIDGKPRRCVSWVGVNNTPKRTI